MTARRIFPLYVLVKNILLLAIDACAYLISMYCAVHIRDALPSVLQHFDFPGFSISAYFLPDTYILLIIIYLVFIWNSLYQTRRSFYEELLLIWKSLIIACLICYLFLFNFSTLLPFVSRIVVLILFCSLMIFIPLCRIALKFILFKIGFWRLPIVILCKTEDLKKSLSIMHSFSKDFYLGFVPIGFYFPNKIEQDIKLIDSNIHIYDHKDDIPKNVVIFIVEDAVNDNQKLKKYLYSSYRKIYIAYYKNIIGANGDYFFSERLLIQRLENQLNSYLSLLIKSIMDYMGGLFLLSILSPLFVILAILIKITSPGPIFYKQKRVGKNSVEFYIWKFRSMYIDADSKLNNLLSSDPVLKKEWDTFFKLKNDPRITSIGKFIRKYSLDELPQLFNVILGEMSLIGPRPFINGEIEELNPDLLTFYAQMKPGLTGLWQISGRNEIDRLERLEIDMWYIQNWSPGLDVLILLNTPVAVITAKGAS